MCELCGDEADVKRERERLLSLAADVRYNAFVLEKLATGKIKPHTEQIARESSRATRLIKDLVAEWL